MRQGWPSRYTLIWNRASDGYRGVGRRCRGHRSGFKFAAAAHAIRPCILSSRFYFQTSECNSVWLFSTSRRSAGRTCSLSATSQMGSPLCARGLLQIHSTLSAPVQILFGINAHECLSNSVTHSILHLSLFLMQIPQRARYNPMQNLYIHIFLCGAE